MLLWKLGRKPFAHTWSNLPDKFVYRKHAESALSGCGESVHPKVLLQQRHGQVGWAQQGRSCHQAAGSPCPLVLHKWGCKCLASVQRVTFWAREARGAPTHLQREESRERVAKTWAGEGMRVVT